MINLISEYKLKQIIGTILCCTGLAFGVVNAEDTRPAASAPAEDPSLWDATKETTGEAWDATKEGSAKAWDATKETTGEAWDATKEGSAKAWDATKETTGEVWDATKEVFTDTDTTEETPAAAD